MQDFKSSDVQAVIRNLLVLRSTTAVVIANQLNLVTRQMKEAIHAAIPRQLGSAQVSQRKAVHQKDIELRLGHQERQLPKEQKILSF